MMSGYGKGAETLTTPKKCVIMRRRLTRTPMSAFVEAFAPRTRESVR